MTGGEIDLRSPLHTTDQNHCRPKILCACAIRNEGWILDHFISWNSAWADEFVFRDQHSSDETSSILRKHNHAHSFVPADDCFDEMNRRQELLDACKCRDADVVVVLDADEFLMGDFHGPEWKAFTASPPGTVACFRWPQLIDGMCWEPPTATRFAMTNDGRRYVDAPKIHTPRIPECQNERRVVIDSISVFHIQYLPKRRNEAKQLLYQAVETIMFPEKSGVEIFRQYNRRLGFDSSRLRPLSKCERSFLASLPASISTDTSLGDTFYREVVRMLREHGAAAFNRIAIWSVRWDEVQELYFSSNPHDLGDPRSVQWRIVHCWLSWTRNACHRLHVRVIDKTLKAIGF